MSKELDYILDHIADLERGNMALRSLLYCTKRSCNNCGKVNCENFQRQRIDCCGLWVSYKDYITDLEETINKLREQFALRYDLEDKLRKENAELNRQLEEAENATDCFNRQEEIIEQAKELLKNIIRVTWGEGWNYSLDWKVKAEQFLKEIEK